MNRQCTKEMTVHLRGSDLMDDVSEKKGLETRREADSFDNGIGNQTILHYNYLLRIYSHVLSFTSFLCLQVPSLHLLFYAEGSPPRSRALFIAPRAGEAVWQGGRNDRVARALQSYLQVAAASSCLEREDVVASRLFQGGSLGGRCLWHRSSSS